MDKIGLGSICTVNSAVTGDNSRQDTGTMRIKVKSLPSAMTVKKKRAHALKGRKQQFYCRSDGNKHFIWFARLLENQLEGIASDAKYLLSWVKVECVNQKIKTIRWKIYGLPDDEYFFL